MYSRISRSSSVLQLKLDPALGHWGNIVLDMSVTGGPSPDGVLEPSFSGHPASLFLSDEGVVLSEFTCLLLTPQTDWL